MSDLVDKDIIIENLKLKILLLEKQLKYFLQKSMVDVETQCDSFTLMDDFNLYKETNNRNNLSIADMLKETSENYLLDSGYSYETKTGLYYHKSSGYYYDPSTLLFYNPKNGIYYSYDSDTQEYKYYSQDDSEALNKLGNEMIWEQGYQHKPPQDAINQKNANKPLVAPCVRIINETTGELEIITCLGGSIGSDASKNHSILIKKDKQEIHLQIDYDLQNSFYQIHTCCDDFRCLLNNIKITQIPQILHHHSIILVNSESYLVHIHDNYETCDWCEPGQIKSKLKQKEIGHDKDTLNLIDIKRERSRSKNVVSHLKIKYGLKGRKGPVSGLPKVKYVDRALIRRKKEKENKNSEDPMKTKDAALEMMFKMGWSPGKSLGKMGTGIKEPIDVHYRLNERAGIGCDETMNVKVDSNFNINRKLVNLQMTRKRYHSLFNE